MFELLLAAGFTAFLLAVLDYAIRVIAISTGPVFVNTVASLILATLGSYLAGFSFDKKIIVVVATVAFLGKAMLSVAERITTYRPVVVNSARQ